jgi:hypothetical protein
MSTKDKKTKPTNRNKKTKNPREGGNRGIFMIDVEGYSSSKAEALIIALIDCGYRVFKKSIFRGTLLDMERKTFICIDAALGGNESLKTGFIRSLHPEIPDLPEGFYQDQ